ncbi:lethal(2)neighbour of tid protein [Chrysoperla carnea]|uniref:lethal(2)neighbour of tid protein n=1 Tax=Chrysoperla carnea TaxID=189513 RepID=UPI001D07EA0E|nr:lethal(2)neighbour of tid protein [Chrysoperla carnea]
MAPHTTHPKTKTNLKFISKIRKKIEQCIDFGINLLINPEQLYIVTIFILIAELFINIFVIESVKYTEIDWKAYMQECEGFLNGTLDYSQLKGDTGPLVYPAGFVYLYSLLYFVTSKGENIYLAQYIFLVIYLLQIFLVLNVYRRTRKVPPYALIITILTSYRVHSIYVLRLFNDTVAVLLFYISLNLFIYTKWSLASFFYSLAVSVKMNILLYAPALFFTYLANLGIKGTIKQLFICGIVQLILGAPFLYGNWWNYIKGSFDLQRIFEHKWTVNYRFLPIELFENRYFHLGLLALHILLLGIFLIFKLRSYFESYPKLKEVQSQIQPQIVKENSRIKKQQKKEKLTNEQKKFLNSFETMLKSQSLNAKTEEVKSTKPNLYSINFDSTNQLLVLPFFVANFIGIVCARSLHYQFYVWYFHSLPYLLFFTNFQKPTIFLILALIEFCWNTYPSTNYSSALLHCCHFVILYGIYRQLK